MREDRSPESAGTAAPAGSRHGQDRGHLGARASAASGLLRARIAGRATRCVLAAALLAAQPAAATPVEDPGPPAAAAEAAAAEVLDRVNAAMRGVESYLFEGRLTLKETQEAETSWFRAELTGQGRPPGDWAMSMKIEIEVGGFSATFAAEAREIDGVTYQQNPMTKEWSVGSGSDSEPLDEAFFEALSGGLRLDGPSLTTGESLDGLPVLKIEGSVPDSPAGTRLTVWVGADDLLIRRVDGVGTVSAGPMSNLLPPGSEGVHQSQVLTISGFNEPIEIVVPEIADTATADTEAADPATAAVEKPAAAGIVDEEYRFRLESPGAGWVLLDEAEIQRIVPDALAGGMADGGNTIGVVIAEHLPEADPKALARVLLEDMRLEGKQIWEFQEIEFQERPAIRYEVTGSVSEIRARFRNIVFTNGDFVFQVLAWGPEASATSGLDAFARAFQVLPGEVAGRASTIEVPDTVGPGWRVREGVFSSAVHGYSVTPAEGWRLALGDELAMMSTDAEIGLVHSQPDVYAVVVVERAAGVDQRSFLEHILGSLRGQGTEDPEASYVVEVAGRPVRVYRFTISGNPTLEFHNTLFFQGEICFQVIAWHAVAATPAVEEIVRGALTSIRFLAPEEALALGGELEGIPDPQNKVGPGYSLRRGVYRSFENGFSWSKPPGVWWIRAGQEAREQNPDATLMLEAPALGINGVLIVEASRGWTGETFHDLVLSGYALDEDLESPRTLQLGDFTARTTELRTSTEVYYELARITTVVAGEQAIQLSFFGTLRNMRQAEAEIEQAIRGLDLRSPSGPVEWKEDAVIDWRLGFAMRPPGPDWQYSDLTPQQVRAIGSLMQWRKGNREVAVVAVCPFQAGHDIRWFETFVAGLLSERLGGMLGAPEREEAQLAGVSGTRLRWAQGSNRTEALVVGRDRSLYAILVSGPADETFNLDRIAADFHFVD